MSKENTGGGYGHPPIFFIRKLIKLKHLFSLFALNACM